MAAGQGEFRVPASEDEAGLWALVEAAWAPLGPEVRQARGELVVRRSGSRADISVVAAALPAFLGILAGQCRGLPADELTSLDRVVERKLWELDRPDVHAVTGGSDDGFLYSRGFVVNIQVCPLCYWLSRCVIAVGQGRAHAGMAGIQGFPARASRITVIMFSPCLAAVEMYPRIA